MSKTNCTQRDKEVLLEKLNLLEKLIPKVLKGERYFVTDEYENESKEKKDYLLEKYQELIHKLTDVIEYLGIYIKLKDDFNKFNQEIKQKYEKKINDL